MFIAKAPIIYYSVQIDCSIGWLQMSSPQFDTANAMKKALEHDDDQYRTIAEQLQNGIFLIDKDHISYANKALIELLGSGTDEKLEGDDLYSMLSEEDAKIIKKDVHQALEGLLSEMEYEVTAVRLDGRKIVIHLLLLAVTFKGRLHVLGVITDLTRIKDIELSLHESKIRYRTLIEHALDGIYIITPDGFEYVNPAFETITGYSQEEACDASFNFYDIIHPDDHQLISEREKARRHGDPLPPSYQFRIITKKGATRYIEVNTVPLVEKEPRVLGMMRDVTERREIVEKAMIGERKYRTLFESANDAIFLMMEDVFIDCNPKTLDMFDLQKEDIVGHHPYEFSPLTQPNGKDSKEEALRLIRAALQDEPQHFYWQHHRRDMTPFDAEVSLKKIELEGSVFIQAIVHDITNQKRAEELLRIAEENYRGIFENAVMGIYKSAPKGHHVSANPALAHIYGYDSAADLMTNMRDIAEQLYVAPQRREDLLSRLLEDDLVSSFESQVYRKDGTIIWISENARTVRDSQGAVEYFVGTVEDITERKQAEEELKKSAIYLDILGDALVILDSQARVIKINDIFSKLWGYTPDEVYGKPVVGLFTKEELLKHQNEMEKAVKKGDVRVFESIGLTKDKKEINVSVSGTVLKDKKGKLLNFIALFRDITEQIKMEEALKESEEQFRLLAESSTSAIFIYQNNRFLYVNPSTETITGFSRQELADEKIAQELVHADDQEMVRDRETRRQQGEQVDPARYEFRIVTKDGEVKWIDFAATRIAFGGSQAALGNAYDITERKKAEEEMERALEHERDFKLRAAHHFFNPIAIAKGYLDLTLEELTDLQEQKIKAARRAICRVEKVVKNVTQKGEIYE